MKKITSKHHNRASDSATCTEGNTKSESTATSRHDAREGAKRMYLEIKSILAYKMMQIDGEGVEVSPGVCVGSVGAALNARRLQQTGVTHVLSVCTLAQNPYPQAFKYWDIVTDNAHGDAIKHHFNDACAFIHEAVTTGGRVLVHCYSGKSLAPALALAYIVTRVRPQADVRQEAQQLHAKRPLTQISEDLIAAIEEYRKQYCAREGAALAKALEHAPDVDLSAPESKPHDARNDGQRESDSTVVHGGSGEHAEGEIVRDTTSDSCEHAQDAAQHAMLEDSAPQSDEQHLYTRNEGTAPEDVLAPDRQDAGCQRIEDDSQQPQIKQQDQYAEQILNHNNLQQDVVYQQKEEVARGGQDQNDQVQ